MTTAPSAGGRRAAICSALKPPHDLPMSPTAPVAPGLRGDPGDGVDAVLLLPGQVLVAQHALGLARAAQVDAQGRDAVARRTSGASPSSRSRVPMRLP